MKSFYKIIIWILCTIAIYIIFYKCIIYFDPLNTNIKGIKSLSAFVAMLASFFIGSSLAKK